MSANKNEFVITKEALLEKAKSLAKPIDFDELIAQGILEKKGKKYKILLMGKLPQHAKDKIIELSNDGTVKFSKATKSAEKLVKKLSK
ncbi:MAG: hypothetical protein FJ264_12370 [Planctomycetes bacterium]|nr:hypothetical protein [Planctomycetota bacterium]